MTEALLYPSITKFDGELGFLSNFYESPCDFDLPVWGEQRAWSEAKRVILHAPTVEHIFQAAKAISPFSSDVDAILAAPSPGAAKRLGRRVELRPDWEDVKVSVMLACLRAKFAPGSELGNYLLSTRPCYLVEGNTWGDIYWGQVDGRGTNMLGRLLMLVRAELDIWIVGHGDVVSS